MRLLRRNAYIQRPTPNPQRREKSTGVPQGATAGRIPVRAAAARRQIGWADCPKCKAPVVAVHKCARRLRERRNWGELHVQFDEECVLRPPGAGYTQRINSTRKRATAQKAPVVYPLKVAKNHPR